MVRVDHSVGFRRRANRSVGFRRRRRPRVENEQLK
jgi:hypothetical protein